MSKQFLDSEGLALVAGYVNGKLGKATTMPSNPKNGQTVLYVGETGAYTKGHIYQYQTNAWIDITSSGFSITNLAPAFGSTTAYDEGDIVTYEGQLYQCTDPNGYVGAWNPAEFSPVDVAELLGEINVKINNIPKAVVPKGTVAFASLPSLASVEVGWMYNISDDFTTTSDFVISGISEKAGSNVYCIDTGSGVKKWDVFAAGGGSSVVVDQSYNPTSTNPQSGTAVAQAIDSIDIPYTAVAYDDFDPSSLTPGVLYLVY